MTPVKIAFDKRSRNKDKPAPTRSRGSVKLEIYKFYSIAVYQNEMVSK